MPQAQHTVVIARPVHEVYAFVADGENNPKWRSSVSDIKRVSGTPGQVGAAYAQGMKGPMGRIPADYEITEAVPDRRLAFRVTAGPARPTGRYEFAPEDGRTRLTFSLAWEPKGLREKLLVAPMFSRQLPKEVATLDELKNVLERR